MSLKILFMTVILFGIVVTLVGTLMMSQRHRGGKLVALIGAIILFASVMGMFLAK